MTKKSSGSRDWCNISANRLIINCNYCAMSVVDAKFLQIYLVAAALRRGGPG